MKQESKVKLELAEQFYKFSLGIKATIDAATALNKKVLEYYGVFSYYKHTLEGKELELTREQEGRAAYLLELVATYMMILQLNKVLKDEWGEGRLEDKDMEKQAISQVVRLIRNAFAHDPFVPTWDISPSARNKEYVIPGVLTFKTHGLHGNRVLWKRDEKGKEYGGQIALLRLLQRARERLSE